MSLTSLFKGLDMPTKVPSHQGRTFIGTHEQFWLDPIHAATSDQFCRTRVRPWTPSLDSSPTWVHIFGTRTWTRTLRTRTWTRTLRMKLRWRRFMNSWLTTDHRKSLFFHPERNCYLLTYSVLVLWQLFLMLINFVITFLKVGIFLAPEPHKSLNH